MLCFCSTFLVIVMSEIILKKYCLLNKCKKKYDNYKLPTDVITIRLNMEEFLIT